MSAQRLWAIAAALAGLAALGVGLAFPRLAEVTAAGACMQRGAVILFEFARTTQQLQDVFAGGGAHCPPLVTAAMDAVNRLDIYAYIPVYTLFCIAGALFLAGAALRPFAIAAIVAALGAAAADYVETLTLLELSHALDAPEPLMPISSAAAWAKFALLGVHGLCCAVLCFGQAPRRRLILGVLLLLPAVATAVTAFDHVRFAAVLTTGFALAWVPLMLLALRDAVLAKGASR